MTVELDVDATLGARPHMAGALARMRTTVRPRLSTARRARRARGILLATGHVLHRMAVRLAPMMAASQLTAARTATRPHRRRLAARLRHRLVATGARDRHQHSALGMRQFSPADRRLTTLLRRLPRTRRRSLAVVTVGRYAHRIMATRRARMLTARRRIAFAAKRLARRTFARMTTMPGIVMTASGRRQLPARQRAPRQFRRSAAAVGLPAARLLAHRLTAGAAHGRPLGARITLAPVTRRRAFVPAARQRLAADLIARRTLAVAALATARVLLAPAQPPALGLARKLPRARQLLGVRAAAAQLLRDDRARTAAIAMAALLAKVLHTIEPAFAGAAARHRRLIGARGARRRLGFAARTRAPEATRTRAGARATGGVWRTAEQLAAMLAAGQQTVARRLARPRFGSAEAHRVGGATAARLSGALLAWRTGARRVAGGLGATVTAAGQQLGAFVLRAFPRALRTANRSRRRAAAQARGVQDLRTRRTGARMAEQQAAMAAGRLQLLLARFAAGVRQEPRLQRRIRLFGAEAEILVRYCVRIVDAPALGTVPVGAERRPRHVLAAVGVVAGRSGRVLGALLGGAVAGPALDAAQMEEIVATGARPDVIGTAHGADADETGGGARVQRVLEELLGFLDRQQIAAVARRRRSGVVLEDCAHHGSGGGVRVGAIIGR